MTNPLLQKAFEKAEAASGKESVNGRAEFLAEYILVEFKYPISTKSLTRYYKGVSSPNTEVSNYLAKFLGYDNYEDFVVANAPSKPVQNRKSSFRSKATLKKGGLLALLLLPVIGISSYMGAVAAEETCMVWNEDHYIETRCTGNTLEQKHNTFILENFKKLEITDTTRFFENGKVKVWYDKSNNQLEFFSAPGLHPLNGKTLKPVSKYIVNKYLLN